MRLLQYLDTRNAYDAAIDEDPDHDALTDCHRALVSAIYRFRKRAARANWS